MAVDIHKVSFKEVFNNTNGKTSGCKFVGVISSMVCLFLFTILVIFYFFNPLEAANILEFIDRTTTYFTVSAGLMGVKSVTSAFGKQQIIMDNSEEEPKKKLKINNSENNLECNNDNLENLDE